MCDHEQFKADCDINRLSETDDGPITGYSINISVKCIQCGQKFRFLGVPAGSDHQFPRASIDGTELRAPIEPAIGEKLASEAVYRLPPRQVLQ